MKTNLILNGDCIEHMKQMPENCVDAIVTDPPYDLISVTKRFGSSKARNTPAMETKEGSVWARKAGGFMGKQWDGTGIAFKKEIWEEALRVLKPGGFLLSFGGTRTYHRLVCGIEDAGFEIRDTIMWLYGSGFPKSLNIGKQIDKMQGNERKVIGKKTCGYQVSISKTRKEQGYRPNLTKSTEEVDIDVGNSEWEGWGTGLKPACEPIVVARKPLSEKNVALNVLKWGTGGINIDECRIGNEIRKYKGATSLHQNPEGINDGRDLENLKEYNKKAKSVEITTQGRFPANIILDEDAGKMLDEQSGVTSSKGGQSYSKTSKIYGEYSNDRVVKGCGFGDKGGASRFFYCAKASKGERNLGCEEFEPKLRSENNKIMGNPEGFKTGSGKERNGLNKNNHPTVKPIKLMEYLIKLVSREGAIVLDPFIGSGTTAIACLKLNRKFIGIEKEEEYIKIINARIKPFLIQKKLRVRK